MAINGVRKKLVYILDRDYCIDKCGSSNHNYEEFEVIYYRCRATLKAAILRRQPCLVMFDLYTNREDPKALPEGINFDDIQKELDDCGKKVDEKTLTLLQSVKELCRSTLEQTHYVSGVEDLNWLKVRNDITANFPIAIFSRHGKSLLTSEQILEISAQGAFLAWKAKENNLSSVLSERELESIDSIIEHYKNNVEQLPKKLRALVSDIEDKELIQKKLHSRYKVWEILFCVFLILSSLSQLEGIVDPTLLQSIKNFLGLAFPKVFPILAIISVCLYLGSKYLIKSNDKALSSIYIEISNVISELIQQRK